MRERIVAALVGLLIVCLCLTAVALGLGAAYYSFRTTAEAAPTGVAPATTPPAAASTSPPSPETQMDRIEEQVIQLRGLEPRQPVTRTLYSTDQLRQHLVEDFQTDYSPQEARDDAIALAALGLLPPGFDLYNFYIDLYTEQILGFYDDETKQLYVISGTNFGATARVIFAHEFEHALQDQVYNLESLGLSDEGWEQDSERAAAAQAIVEGDAVLLETIWMQTYFSAQDFDEYSNQVRTSPSAIYDSAPAYIQKDLIFPYTTGYDFVKRAYDRNGFVAVDAIFKNPPLSTEQILHPERYDADDRPQIVDTPVLTATLGAGWVQVNQGVAGEWYTRLALEEQLPKTEAETAAAGWGGDAYVVFYNETTEQTVLALHTLWDSVQDVEQFASAFANYSSARFGGRSVSIVGHCRQSEVVTCLSVSGQETLWVLAPDEPAARAVFRYFQSPLGDG